MLDYYFLYNHETVIEMFSTVIYLLLLLTVLSYKCINNHCYVNNIVLKKSHLSIFIQFYYTMTTKLLYIISLSQ